MKRDGRGAGDAPWHVEGRFDLAGRDFFPRKWIILLSLLIFSAGTLLSGISSGLIMFVIFRSIATAGGEAFFYPATVSLLAQFHEKTRAQALSILQTALYIGITAGGLIAGTIGDRYGWRAASRILSSGVPPSGGIVIGVAKNFLN